jgi:hypothetical protein
MWYDIIYDIVCDIRYDILLWAGFCGVTGALPQQFEPCGFIQRHNRFWLAGGRHVRPQLFFNCTLCPTGAKGPGFSVSHKEVSLVYFSTFEPINLTPDSIMQQARVPMLYDSASNPRLPCIPDGSFPESGGLPGWRDSIVLWASRCSAHTPTECSRMSEAVLCRPQAGWGPGCFPGSHSTPLPSTRGRPWGVCPAPAHGYRWSKLPVLKSTSGESGGICETDFKPRRCSLHIICTHDVRLPWRDIQAGRLEKMHVQALLSMKVMVWNAVCHASIRFSALHLHFIRDIKDNIIYKSLISYMIRTWMLCLFNFPEYMDCNVGYQIPSSQAMASHSLSTVEADTDFSVCAPSPPSCSATRSARSASRDCSYCRWLSRECARSTVRYTSLLFVQLASRLQLSIWPCSGPWWAKFSDQPNRRMSRTLWRILCAFSKFQPFGPPVRIWYHIWYHICIYDII